MVDDLPTPNQSAASFTEDLGNGTPLEMVYIPGGSFWMGSRPEQELLPSELPQHEVSVPAFYIGKYPVTQQQWRAVSLLDAINIRLQSGISCFQGDDRPVEEVSWYEAMEFCARLSKHTGKAYRLPSEAEWEYACRAGTNTLYSFGDSLTSKQADDDHSGEETTQVGSFPPNGFGLYDMHGNVWEWCQDRWHKNYHGAPTDGSTWLSPDESESRVTCVIRGGSWNEPPSYHRSAIRFGYEADLIIHYIGFRVCCSTPKTS